jgi:predicted membrane channel-forming protein YqfA (hemolysin III family)
MYNTNFIGVQLFYGLMVLLAIFVVPLFNKAMSDQTVGDITGVVYIVCGILWYVAGRNYVMRKQ